MNRTLLALSALLAALVALPALADNPNPFTSDNQPHALVRFNGGLQTQRLIPLYLYEVDGTRVLKKGFPTVVMKPGTYTLQFRAEGIRNRGHVPEADVTVPATSKWRQTDDTLKITLQPGKIYYIAAKPKGNGAWHAVVWKTGDED